MFITPPLIDATNRGSTIAAGGAAQVLMAANPGRIGWAIQNQSSGALYVRSRGPDGTTDATADQNSTRIDAGAYYEAPNVTSYAISIYGATTGQAFKASEW